MSDRSQKTEQATARRLERARREGQFPTAKQFVAAIQFLAFTAMVAAWGGTWLDQTRQTIRFLIGRAFGGNLEITDLVHISGALLLRAGFPLVSAGGALVVITLAAQLAVTRFGLSLKRISPDLQRLNPLARLRELPRQNLPAFIQALVMLPVFGFAVYAISRDHFAENFVLPLEGVEIGARQIGASLTTLLWRGAGLFMLFGSIDLVRQRRRYAKDLRMSRQDIKEEFKETEGNPQMKMRVRRLMRDRIRRNMMKQVPKATAVIVNPTHYAVAIRYELGWTSAPQVVAKGKNYLALRIRQRAVEHQVPLIENPPLAQALYKSAEVGQEIPAHLYRAVAEILAYIYRLMNGRLPA
ncbi:MAG TPA: EscU/YscU/HrcU family type III secretion system export apparatus switch protein [Bryobacteraceae bacterium]|nr:EscU/YscU/HrcU family type III secretion system export apparatus switch protein [Bryobacteraceae bacterium]